MSITPIGYGDIVPMRFEENIVGILCQIVGSIIWVNIIGCVCSTLSKGHPVEERFDEHTGLLNRVIMDTCTPIYNKACTPDNPCFSLHVYAASLHWSAMSITSIGYGDIVLVRFEEYIVGILCHIVGGIILADVIGCVCSTFFKGDLVEERYEEHTDLVTEVLNEANACPSIQQVFR